MVRPGPAISVSRPKEPPSLAEAGAGDHLAVRAYPPVIPSGQSGSYSYSYSYAYSYSKARCSPCVSMSRTLAERRRSELCGQVIEYEYAYEYEYDRARAANDHGRVGRVGHGRPGDCRAFVPGRLAVGSAHPAKPTGCPGPGGAFRTCSGPLGGGYHGLWPWSVTRCGRGRGRGRVETTACKRRSNTQPRPPVAPPKHTFSFQIRMPPEHLS